MAPGEDLRTVLRRDGRLPRERVAAIVAQLGEALDEDALRDGQGHGDVRASQVTVDGDRAWLAPGPGGDPRDDVAGLARVAHEALGGAPQHPGEPLPPVPGDPWGDAHDVLVRAIAGGHRSAGAFARELADVLRGAVADDQARTSVTPARPRRPAPAAAPAPAPARRPRRPRRRADLVVGAALLGAVVAAALVLILRQGEDDGPVRTTAGTGTAARTTRTTTTTARPLPPVPNAADDGAVVLLPHFRTRVPSNWEVARTDEPREQTRLGEALVTTLRPTEADAPDRVTVLWFGSGEFPAKARVDRREATLKASGAYHPLQVASTIPIGPRDVIFWTFETDERAGRVRWERYAFDSGGAGFEVVGGGRPGAVADVAREVAASLDALKECPTTDNGGNPPRRTSDLRAINVTCGEAAAVLFEASATCGTGERCDAGDGWSCTVDGALISCTASGRRELSGTV
jgi:hypothetical protein